MNSDHVRHSVHSNNHHTGAYVRRFTDEAARWSAFAQERTTFSAEQVHRKALNAVAFTLACRAHSLAIPLKGG